MKIKIKAGSLIKDTVGKWCVAICENKGYSVRIVDDNVVMGDLRDLVNDNEIVEMYSKEYNVGLYPNEIIKIIRGEDINEDYYVVYKKGAPPQWVKEGVWFRKGGKLFVVVSVRKRDFTATNVTEFVDNVWSQSSTFSDGSYDSCIPLSIRPYKYTAEMLGKAVRGISSGIVETITAILPGNKPYLSCAGATDPKDLLENYTDMDGKPMGIITKEG